ncbi:hypothetical protein J6590_069865 [Homalodisca vitripennis]|nr:hypothetical protein J6590_069865 [Homalodisca vitripennis]
MKLQLSLCPEYWGRINPDWSLCNKGRRQSPINVEPHKLLFDPHLRHIEIDKHKISGTLINTGQSLVFRVDRDSKQHVNISGGPLAYRYQFEEFFFHYGIQNQHGSEHRIHGYTFPGEREDGWGQTGGGISSATLYQPTDGNGLVSATGVPLLTGSPINIDSGLTWRQACS